MKGRFGLLHLVSDCSRTWGRNEGFRHRSFHVQRWGLLARNVSWQRVKVYLSCLVFQDTSRRGCNGLSTSQCAGLLTPWVGSTSADTSLVTSLHTSPTCILAPAFCSQQSWSNDLAGKQLSWSHWFRSHAITRFDRTPVSRVWGAPRQPYVLFSSAAQWMS